jgi:WD40 repeat protein
MLINQALDTSGIFEVYFTSTITVCLVSHKYVWTRAETAVIHSWELTRHCSSLIRSSKHPSGECWDCQSTPSSGECWDCPSTPPSGKCWDCSIVLLNSQHRFVRLSSVIPGYPSPSRPKIGNIWRSVIPLGLLNSWAVVGAYWTWTSVISTRSV